jgi:UDP-glucose 4-epimerase
MLIWTIGSGGLIGSAVARYSPGAFIGDHIPWQDSEAALTALTTSLSRFISQVGENSWGIVWAAGSATVSSGEDEAQQEADLFQRFASRLAEAALPSAGVMTVVSSAGGIHAGSPSPPFTADTPPAPMSPYGHARLAQEQTATSLLANRWPIVLARISNVYGPGQDITKLQGLISRLAVCSLTRKPLNIFVPLSTVRDFIYVDDVAERIHAWMLNDIHSKPAARVRIIASGQATSIGQLIRTAQDVGHRRVPIAMGTHPSALRQAADSRFVPSDSPNGADLPITSLPIGMKAVFDDILRRLENAVA